MAPDSGKCDPRRCSAQREWFPGSTRAPQKAHFLFEGCLARAEHPRSFVGELASFAARATRCVCALFRVHHPQVSTLPLFPVCALASTPCQISPRPLSEPTPYIPPAAASAGPLHAANKAKRMLPPAAAWPPRALLGPIRFFVISVRVWDTPG